MKQPSKGCFVQLTFVRIWSEHKGREPRARPIFHQRLSTQCPKQKCHILLRKVNEN